MIIILSFLLLGLSLRANYTDRATAACQRNIFLKSHALACIIPSLKHILNRIIFYLAHTHTHTFKTFCEAQH
jgi:hypothetical protein